MVWYGCTHAGGLYPDRSVQEDFLVYGKELIKAIGFDTIRFYMSTGYAGRDYINQDFGVSPPLTLTELAQTDGMVNVLTDAHFVRYIISAFAISQPDLKWYNYPLTGRPGLLPSDFLAEYTETNDLAAHLLTTYSNKEFIITNWEGDWQLNGGAGKFQQETFEATLDMYRAYHATRMRAVHAARVANTSTSTIYYAVEANRVLDDGYYRLHSEVFAGSDRKATLIPDKISLSIYEATEQNWENGENAIIDGMNERMDKIVGRIRRIYGPNMPIFIGEFGWPQDYDGFTQTNPDVGNLHQAVIDMADRLGLEGVAPWQILDNEHDPEDEGVPRGFGLHDRDGNSDDAGPLNAAGTFWQGVFAG